MGWNAPLAITGRSNDRRILGTRQLAATGRARVWGARPVGTGAHVKTKPGIGGGQSLPRLKHQLAPRQQPTVNFQADE